MICLVYMYFQLSHSLSGFVSAFSGLGVSRMEGDTDMNTCTQMYHLIGLHLLFLKMYLCRGGVDLILPFPMEKNLIDTSLVSKLHCAR